MRTATKDTLTGNLACFTAYLIFGFNIIFCKNIANDGNVSPMSLFLLRSAGALLLFCIASTVTRTKERVEVRDLWKIALASMLGLFLTQFSFLEAITMTTAVDASVLSLMTPVMTMIVAAIALRDRITAHGIIGLAVSFSGVLFIVLNSVGSSGGADRTTLGGVLLMFVFSTVYALPFAPGLLRTDFHALTPAIVWQVLFVVVCATFISYFLIPIGQKRLKPMLVCMYSYVQPVVAMCISLAAGMDTMTWAKGVAAVLVFLGVGIVNFSPHAYPPCPAGLRS